MQKLLFTLLLLCIAFTGKAQDCDSLREKVSELFNAAKFQEGLKVALQAEKACFCDTALTEKYVNALFDVGVLYQCTGNIWKALEYADKAISLYKKKFDTLSHDYLNNLNNSANMYKEAGDLQTASKLYNQIVHAMRITSEDTTEYFYLILFNISANIGAMGLIQEENDSLLSLFESYNLTFGDKSYYHYMFVANIIASYLKLGQYEKALTFCKSEIPDVYDTTYYSHSKYTNCINNYAGVYRSIGLYEKAISINNILLTYWTVNHEKSPLWYAWTLNSLGTNYLGMKNYSKAETYFLESAKMRKELLGENNLTYITSLYNIASLYSEWGQYDKGKELHQRLLSLSVGNPLIEGQFIATYMNSYANTLLGLKLYDSSLYYYKKALEFRKSFFGEQHLSYIETLSGLANAYMKIGDYASAKTAICNADSLLQNVFDKTLSYLTANDQQEFLRKYISNFNIFNSFLYRKAESTDYIKALSYSLFLKSLSLNETKKILEVLRATKSDSLKNIFQNWMAIRSYLSKQYSSPLSKQTPNIKQKEQQAQDLEQQLALKSAEYRRYEKSIDITVKNVYNTLQPNEAAIEFTNFQYYGRNGWTDSTLYAAIILTKKDTTPHWVFLFEEKQLKELMGNNVSPNILYSNNKILPYIKGLKGDMLYNLIWKKIEPYLVGINTVYYSPSGMLNAVSLAAMPYRGTAMPLCKKYKLLQLGSTKNLALPPQQNPVTNIVLMGGITYDADSSSFAAQTTDTTQLHSNVYTTTILSNTKSRGGDDYFTTLSATLPEVNSIAKTSEAAGLQATVYSGTAATEEELKKLSGNAPSVIHLATHGFYRSYKKPGRDDMQSTETNFSLIEDPMFRSGVALAGANLKWHKNIDVPTRDDGIVTAYDVAQMDLSKTELVVLSACKSGLGDIDGSEGVFGLQRGFKSAGVNKMIISLWQVPDKSSMEFMTTFYTKWLKEKKDICTAFYNTQLMMYSKYPNAPQNWAGFILIE